jgi:hypothetical protein
MEGADFYGCAYPCRAISFLFLHTCVVPLKTTRACGFNFTMIHVAIIIPRTPPTSEHKLSKAGFPSGISNAKRIVDEKKNLFLNIFYRIFAYGGVCSSSSSSRIRVTASIVSLGQLYCSRCNTTINSHSYGY